MIALLTLLSTLTACGSDEDDAQQPEAAPVATEAPAKNDPSKTISRVDADAIRAQIYPNWYVTAEQPCHQPLKVYIEFAQDGTVLRAEPKPDLPDDDPCRPALDSAIRAVWASSPVTLPRSRSWNALTLVFSHDQM